MNSDSASRAKRFIHSTWAEIVIRRPSILRFLLLSFLVLAPFMIWLPQAGRAELRIAYLLLGMAMCVLAIAIRSAFIIACLLLVPPALIHQHLGRHWGGGQVDARIEAFLESPPGEIREYMQSHIDAIDFAFLACAALYVALLLRWTLRNGNFSSLMRGLAATALGAVLMAFVGLGLERRLSHFAPYELVAQSAGAMERYRQLSLRNDFLRRHPLAGGNCDLRYDKVVIVLGESAISDHMGIFGYTRPTTPFALRSRPYAFDALSPSNQTRYSLAMMLTEAAPGHFEVFYETHSLVGQLRSCGYHTLWISNQGKRGEFDSFSTSMAREANEQIFLNDWSWTSTKLDGQILPELESRKIHERTETATFVHLIGSHPKYKDRFPEGFDFGRVSDVVSNYDSTILYTDHVLSKLYDLFAGKSLLFVYVSDHGQLVSNDKYGSGFNPAYKEEFRTPLLIWTSDSEAIKTIQQFIGDSKINLESFDDVMRFLVGMSPKLNVSTRSSVSILTPELTREYGDLESLPQ